jgi:PIN domain nuclease of toxin-antitoxin system
MRLLLDTHVLLWLLADAEDEIPGDAQEALQDVSNEVLLTSICFFEIAVKTSVGKLAMPSGWARSASRLGFSAMPVTSEHAVAVADLPLHHRDPFDRLLVAQATVEGATVVTADPKLAAYDVPILWS